VPARSSRSSISCSVGSDTPSSAANRWIHSRSVMVTTGNDRPMYSLKAKVITVSDAAAVGERADRTGPLLVRCLEAAGFEVIDTSTVADGIREVAEALRAATTEFSGLVVTTGGTGFGPRDLTPEGTMVVLEREAPGLAEAMRSVNPLGRLSRGRAGTVGQCLVLNLPGSAAGGVESLEAVLDVLPHALALLVDNRAPHPMPSTDPSPPNESG
jgi:molybdopterin adenylyltransferase